MNGLRTTVIAALLAMMAIAAMPTHDARAQSIYATGTEWTQSSDAVKVAYLIGMSNLLNAEHAYQAKSEMPPTDEQSAVPRMYRAIEHLTLDQAVEAIDQWYADHPDQMDEEVIVVIWLTLVEPNLTGMSN